jgi:preprotein translocase subunit SecE
LTNENRDNPLIGLIFLWIFTVSESSNFQIKDVNKVTNYFKESYKELMEKVTWPSWSELQQSTVIVLVATLLITALVYVMDVFSHGILNIIYSFLS